MAVRSLSVVVGVTATPINAAETDYVGGQSVGITVPTDGSTVYLGGSDVSITNGTPLAAGGQISLDLNKGETLYGRVEADTQEVRVLVAGS